MVSDLSLSTGTLNISGSFTFTFDSAVINRTGTDLLISDWGAFNNDLFDLTINGTTFSGAGDTDPNGQGYTMNLPTGASYAQGPERSSDWFASTTDPVSSLATLESATFSATRNNSTASNHGVIGIDLDAFGVAAGGSITTLTISGGSGSVDPTLILGIPEPTPPLSDTVAFYRFDDSPGFLVDSEGNHDLSAGAGTVGQVTSTPSTGKAANFDGSASLQAADSPDWTNTAFTIEAYVIPDTDFSSGSTVDDPHDNPALTLDDSGYLWIFVSGRNTNRQDWTFKSTQPYSADAFELVEVPSGDKRGYPQIFHIPGSGFIHLFTIYQPGRELFVRTSADGLTWNPKTQLADMDGHYQVSWRTGNKVGTMFNRHPGRVVDERTDLFYLQTTDFGATWTTVDGNPDTITESHLYFGNKEGTRYWELPYDMTTDTATPVEVDSPYDRWLELHFTPAEITAGTMTGPDDDSDGDGRTNLREYGDGTDPTEADGPAKLEVGFIDVSGEIFPTLDVESYRLAFDLEHHYQYSTNLGEWFEADPDFELLSTSESGDLLLQTYRDTTAPLGGGENTARFYRRITQTAQ